MKKYEKYDLLWAKFREEWLDNAMKDYENGNPSFSYLSCPEDYAKFNAVQRLIDTCEEDFEVDVVDCSKIRTADQAFGALFSLNDGSVVVIENPWAIYDTDCPKEVIDLLSNIWTCTNRAYIKISKHLTICPFLEGNGYELPWKNEYKFGKIEEISDIYPSEKTIRYIDKWNVNDWDGICNKFYDWMGEKNKPGSSDTRRDYRSWMRTTFPRNLLGAFRPDIAEFIEAWNEPNKSMCLEIINSWNAYLTDKLESCNDKDKPTINNVRSAVRKFGEFVNDVLQ